ncbi:MAG: hypothetical protein WC277_07020 [Bacilli bacterium]
MSETLSSADSGDNQIGICTCKLCGKTWFPRKTGRPKRCPSCRSEFWDRPDDRQKKRTPKRLRKQK